MKYFILPVLFILMQINLTVAVSLTQIPGGYHREKPDSLTEYTGKYQSQQGMQTITAEIYVEKGMLMANNGTGQILKLKHVAGDKFLVADQSLPIEFIRDKDHKVIQVSVAGGQLIWTKVDSKQPETSAAKIPASYNDYLGKYAITMNGQTLTIEISIENGQLWATQLWDGGNSNLDYKADDEFTVVALSVPMKFTRDNAKKVVKLTLNGTDSFAKINH